MGEPVAESFPMGFNIEVIGLQTKPEHNQKLGEVIGYQGDRVRVRLADAEETTMALRPLNLRKLSPEQAAMKKLQAEFPLGQKVEVIHLQAKPEHNGKVAVIVGYQRD